MRLATPRKLTQANAKLSSSRLGKHRESVFCSSPDSGSVIAKVLIETGMDEILAQQRAEDVAIAIQGSLILAQGLEDPSPFQRVIKQLPEEICRDAS